MLKWPSVSSFMKVIQRFYVGHKMKIIHSHDLDNINEEIYVKKYVGVIIVNANDEIVLQQRLDNWRNYFGCLSTFGGHMEKNELPVEAVIRELHEELGAVVNSSDLISLGAVIETFASHQELVYFFFWKDWNNTITGCYEGQMKCYSLIDQALAHPKILDGVRYALTVCKDNQLSID